MIPTEWGSKHACPECARKYYDFGKTEALCPNCGAKAPVKKERKPAPTGRRSNRTTFGYNS